MTTAPAQPPRSPAPWAEIVTGYGPVTVDMLLTLPDDRYIYEVVDGVLVRVAGSGNRATRLAARLIDRTGSFAGAKRYARWRGRGSRFLLLRVRALCPSAASRVLSTGSPLACGG